MIRKVLSKPTAKPARAIPRATPWVATWVAARSAQTAGGYRLPDKPKKPCEDFFSYVSAIYGRPGVGKTTWATSFPDSLLLSCERVSKGIECYDFMADEGGVRNWETFLAAVDLLEKNPDRFRTVVIDTIDAAYNQCLTAVCKKREISHPQDEGHGKAWDAVRREFTETIDRLQRTGRGIVFISHAKEIEILSHSGEKYSRIQPTMSGQAYAFVKAKTDFVFFAEYFRDPNGNPMRVLVTSGDEVVDAKSAGDLPRFLPLERQNGVDVILRAFRGEAVGIDPRNLRTSKQTSRSGGALISKARTEAVKK